MICKGFGANLPDTAKYCMECGTNLVGEDVLEIKFNQDI